jgi:hypothetical protein
MATTTTKILTLAEVGDLLRKSQFSEADIAWALDLVQCKWHVRGDSAAVYENHDLGSGLLGDVRVVSYGSEAAQIEDAEPPVRMPDIGGMIGWRYQLIGICPPADA